ncbi:Hsp70 family protein [Streptoalloteichus hindustanus]|uniref:Hsp70 protein n=1 Tax=Streptoalloteichus hindustanus TaxID=2017 RepID=A0A1M5Q7T1_STRHI|nr:Hsp70 family protein [Streptoalloteichus hindustanus]SHH09523.1 Hsp70 protein [Streptoalloteichus hindustanus]
MPYVLGVDVGTARTTAAVCRLDSPPDGGGQPVRLGAAATAVPTALHLSPDGTALVGEDAEERAPAEPALIARGFPRRVGDPEPMVVGGEPYLAEVLTAVLVRWVADQVAEQEGGPARHVALTHPGDWGAHRRQVVLGELRAAGLTEVTLVPRPVAVAEQHAVRDPGAAALAVLVVNSDDVDCALVRRTEDGGFDLAGRADRLPGVGGDHLADLVLGRVRAELGRHLDGLDHGDPRIRHALWRLRADCAHAAEALAGAPEAVVPVRLPTVATHVRVSRAAVEDLARPAWEHVADALARVARSTADARPPEAAVLAGEAARAPRVASLVGSALRCRVAVDQDPGTVLARGAAVAARWLVDGRPRPPARPPVAPPAPPAERTSVLEPAVSAPVVLHPVDDRLDDLGEPPPRPPVAVIPIELPRRRSLLERVPGVRADRIGKPGVVAAAVVLLLMGGAALTFGFPGDATPPPGAGAGPAASVGPATSTATGTPTAPSPSSRPPSSKPQPAKDGR